MSLRIYSAIYIFIPVNASLGWLNNIRGVYLVQITSLFIGQQGLGHFFRHRPLPPVGWRIVQILRQRRRKPTNTASTTLNSIQATNPLLSMHNYTPLVISGKEKNKHIRLVSQSKLALTARKPRPIPIRLELTACH